MSGANTKMSLTSDVLNSAKDEVDFVKINGNHSYNNNNNNNNVIDKYTVNNCNGGNNNNNNCNNKMVNKNETFKPNQKSQLIEKVPNLFQDKLSFKERFSIFNLKKKLSPSMISLTTVGTEQNLTNSNLEGENRVSNQKETSEMLVSVPATALSSTPSETDDNCDKKKQKSYKKVVSILTHKKEIEETEKNEKSNKETLKTNNSEEIITSKFRRSSSLVRLLGGNSMKQWSSSGNENGKVVGTRGGGGGSKFNTFSGRRKSASSSSKSGPYLERFKRHAKDSNDEDSSSILLDIKQIANDFDNDHSQRAIKTIASGTANTNGIANKQQTWQMPEYRTYEEGDLTAKALRTVSKSLGKLWWKRSHSVDISTPDPEYKVSYLGNVLTGWAKGEGCVEKQLNTLWRNYTQNNKPDVIMRIKVCASGLKATTRQHGLTEYWANRITYCCAPKNYPRVFCWIYRHEGRKLKHELRCHAVLCSKEKIVQDICDTLKANLECALREFKREKILKQNARLSLANAVYENPSLPRRKILLSVGGNNYRPPLERSKSAPKLMAIEEAIGEEGDDVEDTNEPEMKPCCQKDSLYPAMTLGRRHCRRGHSIRRTGKINHRPLSNNVLNNSISNSNSKECQCKDNVQRLSTTPTKSTPSTNESIPNADNHFNSYDDLDEFEKVLKHNNYDANISLANELMPYFERQLHRPLVGSSSCGSLGDLKDVEEDDDEPLLTSLPPTINTNPHGNYQILENNSNINASTPAISTTTSTIEDSNSKPDRINRVHSGAYSDGEEDDYLAAIGDEDDEDDLYLRQAAIISIIHRHSMRKMAQLSMSSDEGSNSLDNQSEHSSRFHQAENLSAEITASESLPPLSLPIATNHDQQTGPVPAPRKQISLGQSSIDSADEEGSLSSGCETASTATNQQDDLSFRSHSQHNYHHQHHYRHQEQCPYHDHHQSLSTPVLEIFGDRLHRHDSSSSSGSTTTNNDSLSTKTALSTTVKTTRILNSHRDHDNINNDSLSQSNVNHESLSSDLMENDDTNSINLIYSRLRHQLSHEMNSNKDSDSECSDESGYVEYAERINNKSNGNNIKTTTNKQPEIDDVGIKSIQKPVVPPKPMPRKSFGDLNPLSISSTNTSNISRKQVTTTSI